MKFVPVVHHLDETDPVQCPYGHVRRVVTGGEGGIANVHVVRVFKGKPHVHAGYNEVYYILSGTGTLCINESIHKIRPGTVAVIPSGMVHSIESDTDLPVEFIIFGTPAMDINDERAKPLKPEKNP